VGDPTVHQPSSSLLVREPSLDDLDEHDNLPIRAPLDARNLDLERRIDHPPKPGRSSPPALAAWDDEA